jgi:hypothetical protein
MAGSIQEQPTMKTLLVFPLFILMVVALFSVLGGVYVSSLGTTTTYNINSTNVPYGSTFQVLSNGTYIFVNSTGVSSSAVKTTFPDGETAFIVDVNSSHTADETKTAVINQYWAWIIVRTVGAGTFESYLTDLGYTVIPASSVVSDSGMTLSGSATFPITLAQGAVLTIIAIVGISVVAGLKVFGSGMDTFTVETIVKGTAYFGIWLAFSAIAQPLIGSVFFVGSFLYLGLTVMYVMGFVTDLRSGGGD